MNKPPRIPLCLTLPRSHAEDRYWLGLARLVETAGYGPLFLLPAGDPLASQASHEAFRVVESGRGEVKTILREMPAAAALVDSPRARDGLKSALPWLAKEQMRRVILAKALPEQNWFFRRAQPVMYSNPISVGSSSTNDLWLPIQPERIFISEERAKEFRRIFQLPDSARIIWLPGGSVNRTKEWLKRISTFEEILSTVPDTVIVFGRSAPVEATDSIREHLFRFGMWRVTTELSEYEEELVWSAASVVWLHGFDEDELFESLIRAVEVGLPVLLADNVQSCQWSAAGFGEDVIDKHFTAGWIEKTLELIQKSSWEQRRRSIHSFEERWGNIAQAMKLLNWLGYPLIRPEKSE